MSDTESGDSELPPGPESVLDADCPACEAGPMPASGNVIWLRGEWWHAICLLESHPQVEQRAEKECPECGEESPYRPQSYGPEARSCPHCVTVFPESAEKREDVDIVGVDG